MGRKVPTEKMRAPEKDPRRNPLHKVVPSYTILHTALVRGRHVLLGKNPC